MTDPFERAAQRAEEEDRRRRRERSARGQRKGFRIHATVFVAVNLLLIAIWGLDWIAEGDGYPWFLFPLGGWGAGLAAHYATIRDAFSGDTRTLLRAARRRLHGANRHPRPDCTRAIIRRTALLQGELRVQRIVMTWMATKRDLPPCWGVRSFKVILACLLLGGLLFCQGASARNLGYGMIGDDVNLLNLQLQRLSYLPPGPIPTSYEWATRDAVMAFQKYVGIDQSGFAGPITQKRLEHAKRPTVHHGGRRAQVDMRRQLVYWVQESGRVYRTVSISTGRRGYRTPRGHFHIFRKSVWSWSHQYHVSMPYASYIVNGVAFHEGDLSNKQDTHGCIHVPQEFAKEFYRWLTMGTPVWIA